jgi:hypothetical protein
MIVINEQIAKRAKENASFSDYVSGSATAEYEALCKEADEKAAKYQDNPNAQAAAERYKRDIGNWINKYNANGASHVSVMIAGPANYNMKKHEKYMRREDTLWEEYNKINDRFDAAMNGAAHPVIHDTDPDALEKLKAKLEKEEEEHASYIEYNKKARKEKKTPLMPYMLQNSNGRIKALRDRIAHLEKSKLKEPRRMEFDGGYAIENTEAGRTQIFFDSKPDAEMRTRLKSSGWHWSPSAGAWQRQMTDNAWYNLRQIFVKII